MMGSRTMHIHTPQGNTPQAQLLSPCAVETPFVLPSRPIDRVVMSLEGSAPV